MGIKKTDAEFRELSYEFTEKLKEINPTGGTKVFLRMAIEFGYNHAIADIKRGPIEIVNDPRDNWKSHICIECGGTMMRTTYKKISAKRCPDCGNIKLNTKQ